MFSSVLWSPSSYVPSHLFQCQHIQNLAVSNSSSWQGPGWWILCTQESCVSEQPWHKGLVFHAVEKRHTFNSVGACPSTLQLMRQTPKSCFQGASSLTNCSGWITEDKITFLCAPAYFHMLCMRRWTRFLPRGHHRTMMSVDYFGSDLQCIKRFSETVDSSESSQGKHLLSAAFSCLQPIIYPVRVSTSNSL